MRDPATKTTLGFLGCVFVLALIVNCGGTATTPATETPPEATAAPGTPSPPGGSGSTGTAAFAGTYNILATKTTDTGCNFKSTFTGQAIVGINGTTINLKIVESATRNYSGTIQPNGGFTTSGANAFFGFSEDGTANGQISGIQIHLIEVMNFNTGCAGKKVVYDENGGK